jgi:DUF971 family protein
MTDNFSTPVPTKIILHKLSRTLEVKFGTAECFILPCAYLRAFSPSAEVRHGTALEKHVLHKQQVNILAIEPVGHYAIKPIFSDGHRTGIYSWSTLYELGINLKKNWVDQEEKPHGSNST